MATEEKSPALESPKSSLGETKSRKAEYASPTVECLGTIQELTLGGGSVSAVDGGPIFPNNRFS